MVLKIVTGKHLDLILSNISNVTVSTPLGLLSKLDHYHPNLVITIPLEHPNVRYCKLNDVPRFNFYKASYFSIISELKAIDWFTRLSNCNHVDAMVSLFYDSLYEIINKYVPKRLPKKGKNPAWFTKNLIKLLKEKKMTRERYLKYSNPRDELEYKLLRKRCHKLYDQCYNEYLNTVESNITRNPKAFWTYIKNKHKGLSSIPANMHLNDKSASNSCVIANLFANQFSNVYSKNFIPNIDSTNPLEQQSGSHISCLKFSEREVLTKINKLNTLKGSGPDNIPTLFIKRCGKVLALPLCIIFNQSPADGTFPAEWKKARILPLFKKGEQSDVKNYRPTSLISCFSKLFGSMVHTPLSQHIETVLSIHQHGFRKGFSVQTNLVSFATDLSVNLDKGLEVDAIYTHFSSAFDKVDHTMLLSKLKSSGVCGSILNWFQSYLRHRPQVVSVNGIESQ